jgi:hypothetical protein
VLRRLGLAIPQVRRLQAERDALRDQLATERRRRRALETAQKHLVAPSPFYAYRANFNALRTMRRHEDKDRAATPGLQTNWLGVVVDPVIHPALAGLEGTVEPFPDPANWHADIAEWAAVLNAVENAPPDSFSMIELGCGWGCWMNNSGVAARRSGRAVDLIGIEGDEGHLKFARDALARNQFSESDYTLHRGIAAATAGTALFPRQDQPGASWGLEPVFAATPEQREAAEAGTHDILEMVSLAEVIGSRDRIDLLHVDIQGGEADLVEECLPLIEEKVAYLVIGTHSKHIEARLFDLLGAAGWLLTIERPAFHAVSGKRRAKPPKLIVDGVQGWRNPKFVDA